MFKCKIELECLFGRVKYFPDKPNLTILAKRKFVLFYREIIGGLFNSGIALTAHQVARRFNHGLGFDSI